MSTAKKIVWIDDNPKRETTAQDLKAEFINVRNGNLEDAVKNLLEGNQPRLVILDHILDKTATENPVFKRGSTIAEAIKEQWPSCPVIGVTNLNNIDDIDQRTRETYDELFPFHNFREYLDRIDSIEKGFSFIAKQSPSKMTDVIKLLKPPEEELDRLVAALPDGLKEPALDASVGSRLYRWVDHLMKRPGFLYDRLWAATLLGLNESGFIKVEEQFKKGKYTGVFSVGSDPRWWSRRLTALLYEMCPAEPGEFSWQTGRRLDGITRRFYSRCYRCDSDSPPETVAYLDSESDEQQPMHLECTVLHPGYKRELYFEDVRMMKDE